MPTVFGDSVSVITVDFLVEGKAFIGDHYEQVSHKLYAALKENRSGRLHQRFLFHRDDAPAHMSKLSRAALRKFR